MCQKTRTRSVGHTDVNRCHVHFLNDPDYNLYFTKPVNAFLNRTIQECNLDNQRPVPTRSTWGKLISIPVVALAVVLLGRCQVLNLTCRASSSFFPSTKLDLHNRSPAARGISDSIVGPEYTIWTGRRPCLTT